MLFAVAQKLGFDNNRAMSQSPVVVAVVVVDDVVAEACSLKFLVLRLLPSSSPTGNSILPFPTLFTNNFGHKLTFGGVTCITRVRCLCNLIPHLWMKGL